MSGDRYRIADQNAIYFITSTVTNWVDIFTREYYREIIVDSLNYCITHKGLTIYSWVVMSNHIHLVCQVDGPLGMSGFLRDFKKFTSKAIVKAIHEIPESRRDWILNNFAFEVLKTGRAREFKLWQDGNHAIEIDASIDIWQKIYYTHNNPVKAGIVDHPEAYLYSSARDYAGMKGLVNVSLIE